MNTFFIITSYSILGGLTFSLIKWTNYNLVNKRLYPVKLICNYGTIIGGIIGITTIYYNIPLLFIF